MPKKPLPAAVAPPPYDIADIAAMQALARGKADAQQQPRALKWIVDHVCRTYHLSFSEVSDRFTNIAEGRRFVGLAIVDAINTNLKIVRKENAGSSRIGSVKRRRAQRGVK